VWLELFKLTAAQGEATSTTLVAPGAVRPITPEAVVVRKVLAALEALAPGPWWRTLPYRLILPWPARKILEMLR
jgi:hypothetical protein